MDPKISSRLRVEAGSTSTKMVGPTAAGHGFFRPSRNSRFKSEDEALRLANDSDYGLGAAVWTRDLSRAHRMMQRLIASVAALFVTAEGDGHITIVIVVDEDRTGQLKTIWIALES
jgi:hypothetical protein